MLQVISPLFPERMMKQLHEAHHTCEETKEAVTVFLQALKENAKVMDSRELFLQLKSLLSLYGCNISAVTVL